MVGEQIMHLVLEMIFFSSNSLRKREDIFERINNVLCFRDLLALSPVWGNI